MRIEDFYNAQAIALNYRQSTLGTDGFLGEGFFPSDRVPGIDLKTITGYRGLPVSLAASTFDAKPPLRNRAAITTTQAKMPFFREEMLVTEQDKLDMYMLANDSNPYARRIMENIFNDARTLVDGANVVAERMRMQLLAPVGGNLGITFINNNVNYTYNYDPDGSWRESHYAKITGANDVWTASATANPIQDLLDAKKAQRMTGNWTPQVAIMSQNTFELIMKAAATRNYIGLLTPTPPMVITEDWTRRVIEDITGMRVVIYDQMYGVKGDDGKITPVPYYPDNIVMLVPDDTLGGTYYGTTPDELDLLSGKDVDVSVVDPGVAVATVITPNPSQYHTIVSEIVLPTFERAADCYALEVAE